MGHMRRDTEHLAGLDHDLFAVDPEFLGAFDDIGKLLVFVTELRHNTALLEQDARQHQVLAGNDLPVEKRIQMFQFNVVPGNVLEHRRTF